MMYSQCKAIDTIIWCNGRETQPKRKKETEGSSTNRQEKEEVDIIAISMLLLQV